jgi:predicted hotdog family 3-hydroxylacyl-ACP dehydratase
VKNEKYFNLAAILPHRPPMILIDRVCSYDVENQSIVAEFDVRGGSMFFDAALRGVPPWVGVEYMAQAMAALNGILGLEKRGEEPKMGFVLGTKKYSNMIDRYSEGETYTVEAQVFFFDESIGISKCEIRGPKGAICATAEIRAFVPENVEAFLLEATDG